MTEDISVDTALKRGHKMIAIPGIIIFSGMFIAMFAGFIFITEKNLVPTWFLPIAFFMGFLPIFIFLWLLWSIRIVDWRLWAFENVRNVHELERRAIQEKLIHKPDSILNKTEIWTKNKKAKWEILKEKFIKEDVFVDDFTIPSETIIYYSKNKNLGEVTLVIFLFFMGVILSIATNSYLAACLVGIFAISTAYIVYTRRQRATNTEPQIILNEKGIETISISFQNWEDIKNEEAITLGSSKHPKNYLLFDNPKGHAKISIDHFDIDKSTLNKLLRIYRGRNQKEKSTF